MVGRLGFFRVVPLSTVRLVALTAVSTAAAKPLVWLAPVLM